MPATRAVSASPARSRSLSGSTPVISSKQMAMFALTYIGYVCIYFPRKPTSVSKTEISETLRETLNYTRNEGMASLAAIDTSFLVSYAVGQFCIGLISQHLSMRIYVTLAFAGAGLSCLMFSFASSPMAMSAAWVVNGFSQSSLNPLFVNYVADVFPTSMRCTATGLWQTSQQIGGVASTTFAAYMLQYGWRSVCFCCAVPPLLTSAALFLFLLEPAVCKAAEPQPLADQVLGQASDTDTDTDKAEAEAAATIHSTVQVQPEPTLGYSDVVGLIGVMNVAMSYFCIKMVRYVLMYQLALFLKEELGLSSANAGYMSTACDIGGTVGGLLSGMVADRLCGGRSITLAVPSCLLASAMLLVLANANALGFRDDPRWMLLALVAVGVFIAGPDATLGGAAAKSVVEYNDVKSRTAAATASGIVNGIGSFGAALQGALTVAVCARFGWPGLFCALAGLMALASAFAATPARLEAAFKSRKKTQ